MPLKKRRSRKVSSPAPAFQAPVTDEPSTEARVRDFYDDLGWTTTASGNTFDAAAAEDLRPAAADYVSRCRLRVREHLPEKGDLLLDAGSGPVQYPEYLTYSEDFARRICIDVSRSALEQAREKIGRERGGYINATLTRLPLADSTIDAVVSLHVIYHIAAAEQDAAVRELLRVSKPGHRIIIVYSNPRRPLVLAARMIRRDHRSSSALYFHAHPLGWWKRFESEAKVTLFPWRFFTAGEARKLIPDTQLGKRLLAGVARFEDAWPQMAIRLGAYPLVVLTKR